MSQCATPATRNEATRHLKTLQNSLQTRPFCPHDGHSRTVANGFGRLRTQKQGRANTSHPPDPQSKTKTLRYAVGKNCTENVQSSLKDIESAFKLDQTESIPKKCIFTFPANQFCCLRNKEKLDEMGKDLPVQRI